jgi:3-oxoacyl-[acyl-carrier protein] reductase
MSDNIESPTVSSGRVVIITGGGQGIGRAFAKGFAAHGAKVVIAEINDEKARAVAAEITAEGGSALSVRTDVSDPASVEAMAKAATDAFGRIDVLVNNAAIFSTLKMRTFDHIPFEEWNAVMAVNVTGVMLAAKACLPAMRAAQWGRIINIASAAVTIGRPMYLHYTTSKAAVIGMSRSMARELGKDGITVNSILPGATFTEVPRETVSPQQKEQILSMQCIPRHEKPEDLVSAALFLASDGAGFITGQSLTVDGGTSHL